MQTILQVDNLTKQFNGFTAVNRVSFEVRAGEIVGLLGPNGAGKTTIIQMLLTLLSPTEGSIEVFGKNLEHHREELLSQMNFAAPYSTLPYNLTPKENLTVFSFLYGVSNQEKKAEFLLREFNLTALTNEKTGRLSSGEQMRLVLAKAFVNNPKLLLLDEPTTSIDPAIARELRSKIHKFMRQNGGAILWTSHNMREIETMSDRIIFLSRGKIVADDTPQNLKKRFQEEDLEEIFINIARGSLNKST